MRRGLLTGLVVLALAGGALPGDAAGGALWVPVLRTGGGVTMISSFPNGVSYALIHDGRSYLRSTDFGSTWTEMPIPTVMTNLRLLPPAPPRALRFATPTVGYALAGDAGGYDSTPVPGKCAWDGLLLRTADTGATWQDICLPETPTPTESWFEPYPFAWMSVWRDGRTLSLMGSEVHRREPGGCHKKYGAVYTTHDAGAHWTRAPLPDKLPGEVEWFDAHTATLIAYDIDWTKDHCSGSGWRNAVWVTRDGGRTFRKVLQCMPLCTAATFVTRDRILAGRTNGATTLSDDGGRTWERGFGLANRTRVPADDPFAPFDTTGEGFWVQDFHFVDARNGFASTKGGGSWRTPSGGKRWVQERSHECQKWVSGFGEVVAATKDRALLGGPGFVSVRVPADTAVLPCEPPEGSVPWAPVLRYELSGVTATMWPDASVTLR